MNLLLTIASVLLIWLGGGEHAIGLAAWAAPVLLLRVVRTNKAKVGIPLAAAAICVGTFLAFYGMSPTPLAVYVVSVIIGSLIEILPYALDRLLSRLHDRFVGTIFLPAAMTAFSWMVSLGGSGSTGNIAYLSDDRLSQLAALGGIWPLVFLPYWGAACINLGWQRRNQGETGTAPIVVFGGVIVAALLFGSLRLASFDNPPTSVRVAGITTTPQQRQRQNEIAAPLLAGDGADTTAMQDLELFGREVADDLFTKTITEARAGARLVVWSEAAIPLSSEGEDLIIERAKQVAAQEGITLGITPAVLDDDWQRRMEAGEPFLSNRLIMISPSGEIAWTYEKTHLVPGYEQGAFHPGDGVLRAVDTEFGPVVGNICFDADFPKTTRSAGRMNAAVLVVPSNDWLEIRNLHALTARMRAVENGVSLLRPTSAGLSFAADAAGRIVARVDFFNSDGAPLVAELPIQPTRTLYSRVGDVFAYACCGAAVAVLFASVRRKSRPDSEVGRTPAGSRSDE